MKKTLTFLLFFTLSLPDNTIQAQSNPGQELAEKIARRLKDSLSLSSVQYDSILAINFRLHVAKMSVRQQYRSVDTLTRKIQAIEDTRDMNYIRILNAEQFQLYKSKKLIWVRNN